MYGILKDHRAGVKWNYMYMSFPNDINHFYGITVSIELSHFLIYVTGYSITQSLYNPCSYGEHYEQ